MAKRPVSDARKRINLKRFIALSEGPPIDAYDDAGEARKEEYLRLGRAVCSYLAEALGLEPGSYDIRVNRSGIAGPGDITLHGEWIYVSLEQSCLGPDFGFMYRNCQGRKDSRGGPNQWMRYSLLENLDDAAFKMKRAIGIGRLEAANHAR